MSTSSIKRQIRSFHVVVVQWTSMKCTKKRDASTGLLFWSCIKPNCFFWSRRCGRRRGCLSSLITRSHVRYIKILIGLRGFLVIFLSIFGLVFFVFKSLLGIARQWSRKNFAILTLKPCSHVRIQFNRSKVSYWKCAMA